MTLPKGTGSGRGRAHLGKACPPRAGATPAPKPAPRPLQRKAPLTARSSPQQGKVVERRGPRPAGEEPASFSSLKPSRGKRAKAKDATLAAEWRTAVLDLWFPGRSDDDSEVPCPITGADLRQGFHIHHWLERDVLWQHGLAARVVEVVDRRTGEIVAAPAAYHPFVGVPIAERAHMDFTNGALAIPRACIPMRMWGMAAVLDDMDDLAGPAWATTRLELDYPEAT